MGSANDIQKPWIETPLIESATLSKLAGCRIFLKMDLLQPSGSFKSRGVGNFIHANLKSHSQTHPPHFYISSGGNAGLAAVRASQDLNCKCTVVVPHSTKPFMINKLHQAGATEVIQHGASWFEADTHLREQFIIPEHNVDGANVYVPPFDHPLVWEGASSMIDEIARQLPAREGEGEGGGGTNAFAADAVICSVGGGGLFNGTFELASNPPPGVEVTSVVRSDAEAARGVVLLADETRLQVELACGVSVEVAVGKELKKAIPDLNPETRVVVVVCGGSNVSAEIVAGYREQLAAGWE
ncbi:hypothetical protein N7509_002310 [Penicillium cosmopolitanum]|uniref:L-serine ammonia-lyase n=1 Tax=Penicillium cosmopolitanum TaxID=1131564 RepID=A0A9W9W8S7_9EURO|nr:uncharacterized protein N7509_002310 [Penicillium cosmopolitanum]KAJ5408427.1 hypothetical protein N7509_002310 [Penicillium cosmopolitanum]